MDSAMDSLELPTEFCTRHKHGYQTTTWKIEANIFLNFLTQKIIHTFDFIAIEKRDRLLRWQPHRQSIVCFQWYNCRYYRSSFLIV